MKIYKEIDISKKTTFGIGNKVKYYIEIENYSDLKDSFRIINQENLNYFILGEGSNTIGVDFPVDLVILHPSNHKVTFIIENKEFEFLFPLEVDYNEFYNIKESEELIDVIFYAKRKNKKIKIISDAGVNWDYFVFFCMFYGIQQFIPLSGIPGQVGSTPIQNVGAYGEEIKNYISRVYTYVIDIEKKRVKKDYTFPNEECNFTYRNSIFKKYLNQYYIDKITFELEMNFDIQIKYKELQESFNNKYLLNEEEIKWFDKIQEHYKKEILKYYQLRKCVYFIRSNKGMILQKNSPLSKTAGSFFLNPILTEKDFNKFINKIHQENPQIKIPYYKEENFYKLSAAWLIEYSGFYKGYKNKNQTFGISPLHSLAIINYNGSLLDLKIFIQEIQNRVYDKTQIHLHPEPVFLENFIY